MQEAVDAAVGGGGSSKKEAKGVIGPRSRSSTRKNSHGAHSKSEFRDLTTTIIIPEYQSRGIAGIQVE